MSESPDSAALQQLRQMTDAEIVAMLRSNSPLAKARLAFSNRAAQIEQAETQRLPPTPIALRRMEFEATLAIAAALGVALEIK